MSLADQHPADWIAHNIRVLEITKTDHLMRELARLGADPRTAKVIAGKTDFHAIRIDGISEVAANILKTEMLAAHAEAALPHDVYFMSGKPSNVIVLGTRHRILSVCKKLSAYGGEFGSIADDVTEYLAWSRRKKKPFRYRGGELACSQRTHIFGILNATPDSFFDGGKYYELPAAIERTNVMIAEGAHVIDVGGQSTRPGAPTVALGRELERTIPLIRSVKKIKRSVISIDTCRWQVAEAAMAAGAHIINDVTGFRDRRMREIAARTGAGCVVMHMQGTPRTMQKAPVYKDVIGEIMEYLDKRVKDLMKQGIEKEFIAVDPGIGFGKSVDHNLIILDRLREFRSLGCPVLVGTSRKSFIGKVQGSESEDRLAGTVASNVAAIRNGADILRVHDVKEVSRAARIAWAILNAE